MKVRKYAATISNSYVQRERKLKQYKLVISKS